MIGRVLLAGAFALQFATVPAHAAPERCEPEKASPSVAESWAQRRLDVKRVWPLTMGQGVTVAVIDSGVDETHPQIRLAGKADLTNTSFRDCVGHGTAVAGIIAGQPRSDLPFYGVAPAVRLLSIKQTTDSLGDVSLLAKAIRTAADENADVINVSIQAHDQPELKSAVEYALGRDIVIVAAAGNVEKDDGSTGPAYPAAYDGVLSVGSATPNGGRSTFSNPNAVAVLGPGEGLSSTWTGKGYRGNLEGTSYAAPYVAGVAALVRSRHPQLDQLRVRRRITLTADGASGKGTGAGMVNPLLAVTTVLPSEQVAVAPPVPDPLPASVVDKVVPPDQRSIEVATAVAAGGLSLAGVAIVTWIFVPMGRRRGWRAGSSGGSGAD
ncbi:S8 family serine peptidase [Nonomuraea gerenzanensis]|uniref:Peptidase S8 and S53, subtilisin, kexin, sedolisin n=1 Tax=Nonomuraea gerenzanensis TaxID=93944 RepID=A0A1M4E0I2_9ACTN|nr:S8 family serine peptidase [Nonomuraea gerenzanensis]UBU14581.1 S8 family serine peptidase [Nonomuraea gerenzanensis]SBO92298.1 peptidase S8 and S53, subtilisin, kexin, sedolisin [Nonomuraea gerenzanensis]